MVWYSHLLKNVPQLVMIHTVKDFDIVNKAEAGIKIARRNINNFRYADDTTLLAEKRRTKEPLDESERGEIGRAHV